ncbi:MAG TPA: AAA family ATPase, partial [Polyangiaceae bacterium]
MSPEDSKSAETCATKLLGRVRELEELRRALADVTAGRGRLILFTGEPGIGKTSLADAASALSHEHGFSVHWGRSWEAGGAPAYFPWLGILSGMAASLDEETLSRSLGDGIRVLAELVPELGERLPHSQRGAEAPPEEARFRVWRAIVALAREASKRSPHGITVVLDDLHAADRSSLLLLHFLARELRALRLLVIATYRDAEAELDGERAELIARIAREGTRLSLPRLGASEISDFIRERAGEVEPSVVARISADTQGNPLFVTEMVRLLAEQGPESIGHGAVPHGVREVIRQRTERVSAATHELLEVAAVMGDVLEPLLLKAALGREDAELKASLVEATRAGVLVERGRTRRFGHALFREVLYRELDDAERRRLHGRVSDALERSLLPGSPPPHAELAHHALAGPPELLERGVAHAVHAARRAAELLAYDEAVGVLRSALGAVTENGNRPALRGDLLVALGAACISRGESALGKR